jgi:hypothetical protein
MGRISIVARIHTNGAPAGRVVPEGVGKRFGGVEIYNGGHEALDLAVRGQGPFAARA